MEDKNNTFQFHVGSIKTLPCARWSGVVVECFNSTLVRLRLQQRGRVRWTVFEFQFHVGSIKTRSRIGRIAMRSSFNSTLVRLRPTGAGTNLDVMVKFQFHVGSIKTIDSSCSNARSHPGFNSTLVRLRRWAHRRRASRDSVSIPRWFD